MILHTTSSFGTKRMGDTRNIQQSKNSLITFGGPLLCICLTGHLCNVQAVLALRTGKKQEICNRLAAINSFSRNGIVILARELDIELRNSITTRTGSL